MIQVAFHDYIVCMVVLGVCVCTIDKRWRDRQSDREVISAGALEVYAGRVVWSAHMSALDLDSTRSISII